MDSSPTLRCPECAFTTTQRLDLRLHLLTVHPRGQEAQPVVTYACPIPKCRFETSFKGEVGVHLHDRHDVVLAYVCPKCGLKASCAEDLDAHMSREHGLSLKQS